MLCEKRKKKGRRLWRRRKMITCHVHEQCFQSILTQRMPWDTRQPAWQGAASWGLGPIATLYPLPFLIFGCCHHY